MISAAPGLWNHMIYLEYLEGEIHPAAAAQSFLLTEEDVPVLAVGDGGLDVFPFYQTDDSLDE